MTVIRDAFAEMYGALLGAARAAGESPCRRLHAICRAYLHYAHAHPQRYREMFGGWRLVTPEDGMVAAGKLVLLGSESLHLLAGVLTDCVVAGVSGSADPAGDAVALWLALHGLAHQRAVCIVPLGPPDIADRIIAALAYLKQEDTGPCC